MNICPATMRGHGQNMFMPCDWVAHSEVGCWDDFVGLRL